MKSNLKQLFHDNPEVLRLLEQKEQTKLLNKIAEATLREVSVKGASQIKGEKGDTPKKGVDYFTPAEIEAVSNYVKENLKDEVRPVKFKDYFTEEEIKFFLEYATPKKGFHYNDGADGKQGPRGEMGPALDEEKVVGKILKRVILPKEDEIIKSVIAQLPPVKVPTTAEIIKEIKDKKLIEKKDVRGMRLDMDDQRWHGGGLSKVSHDNTLTGDGTPANPLSVVSSSSGYQQPTGVVDGINDTFDFAVEPNVIVVDQGRTMQKVSSDGTVNWTGTTTVILSVAPNYDIFSIS